MKKHFLLSFLSLFASIILFAAAPTVPSSNLTFNSLDGRSFTGNFTAGNGVNRIVVMKQGSPVTGVPVNGVQYNANSNFGTAGSEFTATGEYVVSRSSWSSFSVSNLQPATVYYIAVFEVNGSGAASEYLMVSLTGNQSTLSAPTIQASAITSTGATGNTVSLSWTKGNGSGRILLARKGGAVSADPTDLTFYIDDANFGNGSKISTDNYVVYRGAGASATVKNLEPNTTYHFALYELNGSNTPLYLKPAAVFSATTNAGPGTAPTGGSFSWIEGTSLNFGVNPGNGTRRLYIAKKAGVVTFVPVNGVVYTANAAFGTPATEVAPGEFVVNASGNTSFFMTNLEPNTTYHFRVYEYDQTSTGQTYYLTSSSLAKSGSTATTPTTVSTGFTINTLTGSSASISFTPGNGTYRTVLVKAGSAVDARPVDLTTYSANASFGSGNQLGSGNYFTQFGMNGASVTVTNLVPGTTYHLAVYEYNGNTAPVYSATAGRHSFTVPLQPTQIAASPAVHVREGGSLRIAWNNGNGSRRLVVAKKGSAVTSAPVDQVNYTANSAFGQGTALAPNEYVVSDGTNSFVDLTNLLPGTTYHIAVYEYNVGADGKPDYLTSSWLAYSTATHATPTTQTILNPVSGIQASQVTINFTSGNGASRIFVMKQGAPVSVAPQDLIKYTYNQNFGTAAALISDDNYVVALKGDGFPFSVYNLQPNTTYHLSAFEYNGTNEPVYLRTVPATISFTTSDVVGATTPTIAATAGQITGVDGNKFTFKWTNGNGQNRIVVARKASAVTFVPASATAYPANAAFGSGTDLGGGQYVVYQGNSGQVEVTNLEANTQYFFTVYEYNGTTSLIRYLTAAVLNFSGSTSTPPATAASGVAMASASGQLTLNWTNGDGSGRLVVLREDAAVTAVPANQSAYPANSVFRSGAQVALGEYAVYAGSGSSVTITGLSNKTYHYAIFEYNGASAPVYNTASVARGFGVVNSTLPVRLVSFTVQNSGHGVQLKWSTAQEVNNRSFVVERSQDGHQFTAIATIAGAGNSNTVQHYSYADANAHSGKSYYRLKQVDNDGKFSYSDVQMIERKAIGDVQVYPNPVSSQLNILFPANMQQAVVKVFDARGIIVENQRVTRGAVINASRWSNGVYFIQIESGGTVLKQTIVKQ